MHCSLPIKDLRSIFTLKACPLTVSSVQLCETISIYFANIADSMNCQNIKSIPEFHILIFYIAPVIFSSFLFAVG